MYLILVIGYNVTSDNKSRLKRDYVVPIAPMSRITRGDAKMSRLQKKCRIFYNKQIVPSILQKTMLN